MLKIYNIYLHSSISKIMRVFHSSFFVCTGVLILYFSSHVLANNSCDFNVKVKQVLLNEGFHRNITYGIVFSSEDKNGDWLYKDCIVALDQTLPPGVFINPDELGEFKRTQHLNIVPKNPVNIELSTEQSEPTTVYILGEINENKVYLWMPVHARYHKSASGGGSVRNEIEAPKLYLRCPDQRLDLCGKAVSPPLTFLCNGSSREKCSWKEIPTVMLTDTLVWEVPVGDLDHYYAVAIGTTLAIFSGSVYLLQAAHEFKSRKKRL